ncbi:MAG: DUF222 domain-containing protein [Candidatus Nanopelagicales bacterium]
MTSHSMPPEDPFAGAGGIGLWDVDQAYLEEWANLIPVEDGEPVLDDCAFTDEDALAGAGEVSVWDLPLLDSIDPRSLDRVGRIAFLQRSDALDGVKAAQKMRAIVAIAGERFCGDSMADRAVTMEVALALRIGEGAAGSAIAVARSLHTDYPRFLDALSRGQISEWHARELVTGTRHVTDPDVIAKLQDRLLPKAKRKTPAQFRTEVRKAVCDLDAEKAAERLASARADRYVTYRPLGDGMAYLGLVADQPTVFAMFKTIDADAKVEHKAKGGAAAVRAGDDDAAMDACRADALTARVLGTVAEDGTVSWDRSNISVSLTLVMDLDTLRGEADRHALLDGEPIPADAGREHAQAARLWRRAVTDPVTGHLLDFGTEQYLPDPLRRLMIARDLCRAPGCNRPVWADFDLDHSLPFPQGKSSAANCGGLCRHHHQLKTQRYADLLDSAADGSGTWITGLGQQIRIPPRPFLHDPLDHTHNPEPPAEPPDPPEPPKPPKPPLPDTPPF